MKTHRRGVAIAASRALLMLAWAVVLLSISGSALAQEGQPIPLSDSTHVTREPFYVPSMSPGLTFISPRLYDTRLSFLDEKMIDSDGHFSVYSDTWKRSFLLGASVYRTDFRQASHRAPRKETFLQKIQLILGVAELAGVGYLGYKAIKKEPITKKK